MTVFKMYRGDDKIYELTVTDKQTGNPVSIVGCTIKMTWKENIEDETYFLQKSNGPGEHSDPTNGKTEFTIDAADTSALKERTEFYFDVQITKTTTKVETLLKGSFVVLMDVTT